MNEYSIVNGLSRVSASKTLTVSRRDPDSHTTAIDQPAYWLAR